MKKRAPRAIDGDTLSKITNINLHRKIKNRTRPGNIYLVKTSVCRTVGRCSENINLTIPIYSNNDSYTIIPHDSKKATEEYMKNNSVSLDELIKKIINDMNYNNMFSGIITKAIKVDVVRYAGSINEYYSLKELSNDELDVEEYVESLKDGVYWVYDNSNRRKGTKQPPFMVLKRDGEYTIIDVDDKTNFTFTNNCTSKSIISRATLNFQGSFSIVAVKR